MTGSHVFEGGFYGEVGYHETLPEDWCHMVNLKAIGWNSDDRGPMTGILGWSPVVNL